jgi:hypothetical protein
MKELFKELIRKTDFIQAIAALTALFVFVLVVFALIYVNIPVGNKEPLIHVLGIIEGTVMAIIGYYYGSSKGAHKKTDSIDKITDQ